MQRQRSREPRSSALNRVRRLYNLAADKQVARERSSWRAQDVRLTWPKKEPNVRPRRVRGSHGEGFTDKGPTGSLSGPRSGRCGRGSLRQLAAIVVGNSDRRSQRIRDLLHKARAVADAALDGVPESPDAVASMIDDLHSTMAVHLAFEKKVLLPLFLADRAAGLRRASQLQDEHRRQREVLAAIHREACRYPQLPTLAAKLAFLTSWLLADMDEEERSLAVHEDPHDDVTALPRGL
jgi:hypothetical protein